MKIMGIDPGLTGGIAFYDGNTLWVFPTPVVSEEFIKKGKKSKRNLMDLEAFRELVLEHQPDVGVLEKVTARTGQGVTSMFRFGMNFGEYRAGMTFARVPFIEVTPQRWKSHYNIDSEKNTSMNLARELFPDNAEKDFRLKKQDGMAEAALIAKFGFDNVDMFMVSE